MTDDSWKGEHLIRAKPTCRISETRSLVSRFGHKARRERGEAAPASAAHSRFVVGAVFKRNKAKDEQRQ